MDTLQETFLKSRNLHHAYVLEGEREAVREKLLKFLDADFGFVIQGNPDFFHERYESFSIDDARKLRDMQAMKAVAGDRKVYIIETLGMTVEAQNSLLKIFEEPSVGTHFFIITPSAEIFLPTLRSRVVISRSVPETCSDTDVPDVFESDAKKFLQAAIPERLETVSQIAEEKDKMKAIVLVSGLIQILHGRADSFVMSELLQTREYLSDRSPSLKLLLEYVALIVPKI